VFMCWNLWNLKENGEILHQQRMGPQAACQHHLLMELQVQINQKDSHERFLLDFSHLTLGGTNH
jgi:hypothetical protein